VISTGKKARKRFGTRAAAKRGKPRNKRTKEFGQLPVSVIRGNADGWRSGRKGLEDVA